MAKEGVIKFHCHHRNADLHPDDHFFAMVSWRKILMELQLTGQRPDRYDGLGYGNMSYRLKTGDASFCVTGTQTGHEADLKADHCAVVTSWNISLQSLTSHGGRKPSSESLSHAGIYGAMSWVNAVIHIHSRDIWTSAEALGLLMIAPEISYGSLQMATALSELATKCEASQRTCIVAMAGHEDGLIGFGVSMDEIALRLILLLQNAYKLAY